MRSRNGGLIGVVKSHNFVYIFHVSRVQFSQHVEDFDAYADVKCMPCIIVRNVRKNKKKKEKL